MQDTENDIDRAANLSVFDPAGIGGRPLIPAFDDGNTDASECIVSLQTQSIPAVFADQILKIIADNGIDSMAVIVFFLRQFVYRKTDFPSSGFMGA